MFKFTTILCLSLGLFVACAPETDCGDFEYEESSCDDAIYAEYGDEYLRTAEDPEEVPETPDLWQLPMECDELDGEISLDGKKHDVDFEKDKSSRTGASGEFDGPGWFDGDWSYEKAKDGTQTLSVDASGHGKSMDLTLTVSPDGTAKLTGKVNGEDVDKEVEIEGDGSLSDPFTVTVEEGDTSVSMSWATECGEIEEPEEK